MVTKPTIYTRDFVEGELADIILQVDKDQSIVFIGQIFEKRKYSRQRYSEWAEKFKDDEEISDAIKKIDELIESRLVVGALSKELNPVVTIFTLKNKHDWKDKTETDVTTKGDSLNSSNISDKTLQEFTEFIKEKTKG